MSTVTAKASFKGSNKSGASIRIMKGDRWTLKGQRNANGRKLVVFERPSGAEVCMPTAVAKKVFGSLKGGAARNPRITSKAAYRHGKHYRYVVQGGPSQPSRGTDSLKTAKKLAASMIKKAPHEWVDIFDETTNNFVYSYRGEKANPKSKSKRSSSARRRNISEGFVSASGFHPIRSAADYDPARLSSDEGKKARTARRKRLKARKASKAAKKRSNPKVSGTKDTFVTIEPVKIDRQGYEKGGYHDGKYWGVGQKLWRFWIEKESTGESDMDEMRAASKADVMQAIKRRYPHLFGKKNPKAKKAASGRAKRKIPAAFKAAAERAKAMTPAQRAAWAKKMQAARKRAKAARA